MANGHPFTIDEIQFLTVKECAHYLRITPPTFYSMINSKSKNAPPRKKIGGIWRIPKSEFMQWIATRKDT